VTEFFRRAKDDNSKRHDAYEHNSVGLCRLPYKPNQSRQGAPNRRAKPSSLTAPPVSHHKLKSEGHANFGLCLACRPRLP